MFYNIAKRLIDIVGAIVGIVLFFPIMLCAAIWVKLVSPEGPVFADIPMRVGKDKKPFFMFKFRSMIPGGTDYLKSRPELYKKYVESGYKLDPDPRLIKGAKFLRKTSIDELPQFFNVLTGSMSLVGPRAYYFYEIEERMVEFPESKKYFDVALRAKPGITGPWQVGGRSALTFLERVKLDAEYAKNRSILYDLLIILKTPFAVLSSKGAY